MKFPILILFAVLAVLLFAPAGLFAADLGSPIPLEQRVTDLERRVAALEQRTGQPTKPAAAARGEQPYPGTVVVPVGTVGRAADGSDQVCTPAGWQPVQTATVSATPVVMATTAPIVSSTAAVVSSAAPIVSPFAGTSFGAGTVTVCGPNGCSVQPAGIGHGGLIRRSLGLFR